MKGINRFEDHLKGNKLKNFLVIIKLHEAYLTTTSNILETVHGESLFIQPAFSNFVECFKMWRFY